MGFFENLKWFFQEVHDANKELALGIKNVLKEEKTETKDLIKQHNPVIGEIVEKIDRGTQTVKNFIEANNPTHNPSRKFRHEHEPRLADHLIVKRDFYFHHGIYVGNDRVVHFSDGYIKEATLDDFKKTSTFNIKDTPITYSKEAAISRAYSKLGQSSYNLFSNNCEHFVNWCRSGGKYSDSI